MEGDGEDRFAEGGQGGVVLDEEVENFSVDGDAIERGESTGYSGNQERPGRCLVGKTIISKKQNKK